MCKLSLNQNLTQILNPEYVEVVSDGSKTIHSILAELFTLVDLNKVSGNTYMFVDIPNVDKQYFTLETMSNVGLRFTMTYTFKNNNQYYVHRNTYRVSNDGGQRQFSADTSATSTVFGESASTDTPPSGRVFRIYYK
jgi:hypothetical protein